MRFAIRADASVTIGTGHVMRQIALAQHLLGENHEVRLFASITGPDWLRKYVESQSGLDWLEVEEGDFSADIFLSADAFDALVVDAYALDQQELASLEETIPIVAVIIDGPWQDLNGQLAIAPTLDRNPAWVNKYQQRFEEFHWGPEFFLLRREVIEARNKRLARIPNSQPRIVVALGGSDIGGKTVQIVETLASAFPSAEIDAYIPDLSSAPAVNSKTTGVVSFHASGPEFIDRLVGADFAVVGAGTTVAEVLFVQVPAIFVVVADNQMATRAFLQNAEAGASLVLSSATFETDLAAALRSFRPLIVGTAVTSELKHLSFDGRGTEQVARLIIARARVGAEDHFEAGDKNARESG